MIVAGIDVNTTTVSSLVSLSDPALDEIIAWVEEQREEQAERAAAAQKLAEKALELQREDMEKSHKQQEEWARRHLPE